MNPGLAWVAGAAALVFMAATTVQGIRQDDAITKLTSTVERQQRDLEQDGRQIAQLNGRVFLGTDIPDLETGQQP